MDEVRGASEYSTTFTSLLIAQLSSHLAVMPSQLEKEHKDDNIVL